MQEVARAGKKSLTAFCKTGALESMKPVTPRALDKIKDRISKHPISEDQLVMLRASASIDFRILPTFFRHRQDGTVYYQTPTATGKKRELYLGRADALKAYLLEEQPELNLTPM